MIRVFFVGDGPRDEATVRPLVEKILDTEIECVAFHPWRRLHGKGKGYDVKLRYAIIKAKPSNPAAIVAVVDRDKDKAGHRLAKLHGERDSARSNGDKLPIACGEANPHGEAWLLDDPVAIREALGLSQDVDVVSPKRTKNPKGTLDLLIEKSRYRWPIREALAEIAASVQPARCLNADRTGFAEFVDEIREELGPLVRRSPI